MSDVPAPLETPRLVLLPLRVEHAGALFEALRDPEVYRFIPADAPQSVDVLQARYRRTSAGPALGNDRWWNWAVASRERPARPFGTVELTVNGRDASALLGYVFGRSAWGHGFAFEACGAAIAYLRTVTSTPRIDAYVDTRNERSVRLLERLGMQRLDTLIGADRFKGARSDEYHYRLDTIAERVCNGQTQSG